MDPELADNFAYLSLALRRALRPMVDLTAALRASVREIGKTITEGKR